MFSKSIAILSFSLTLFVFCALAANGGDKMPNQKMLLVYDKDGNQYQITAEEWRKKVLPTNIKKYWNDPEGLYSMIHMAFQDGFGQDVLDAAVRLKEIKPDERSYSTLGVLQIQQKQLKEAEKTFNEQMKKFGQSSFALNYLAKIYAETGRGGEVDPTLHEALKVNPNENNAVEWWTALRYEKGGEAARTDALKQLATLPGSWLPQLYLGRITLEKGSSQEAIEFFKKALNVAPEESYALLTISGELGKKGLLREAIVLVAPLYKPTKNDVSVGFNLLEAYRETKDYENGLKLLGEMERLERFDLVEKFNYYSDQFNKMKAPKG